VSGNVLQVSVMSVQDPFVLDHNTTSNVSERMRCDIAREFQRASTQCRNLIGCDDSIGAEHAGIVDLLSDSTSSSVGSPAGSLQLALNSPQTTDENATSVNETAAIQLFVLRAKQSAKLAAADPQHRLAEPEHSVAEQHCEAVDGTGSVSWHSAVVDIIKLMLSDIFDVDCVSRDRPSDQFDSQLSQLLTAGAGRDVAGQACDVTGRDSATAHSPRKRLLPHDQCDDDIYASDNDPSPHRAETSAAKRYRPTNSASDDDVTGSSTNSGQRLNVTDSDRHVMLSVDCSARSRLWVGRKKVRRQFLHFSDELKRQLEVSSVLRSKLPKSDQAILEFEMAVIGLQRQSVDELLVAVIPSKETSKEFGCFITFFISLLQKLVSTISVEGPVVL